MSTTILSVKSLTIEFLGRTTNEPVVRNLSFDIDEGETLAIVGESGSGKSVSSLSILQLLNPENSLVTGEITLRLAGKTINLLELDVKDIREYRGSAIAMIFQEPMAALNPVQKCGEQVNEILTSHTGKLGAKASKQEVLRLFGEVELPRPKEIYTSYPYQLSGGQQQRVMIAMALANKPVLLIADEPTTALDPKVQDEILALIKQLQLKNKMALLFISHDLDAVKKVADKVLVMQHGEVRESGLASEVFSHPKHPYTRGLLNCKPDIAKKGLVLPTVADFLENPDFQSTKLPAKQIGEILLALSHVSVVYKSGGLFKKKSTVTALNDVSFSVRKGETVGVIGPSGCGKTTIGRVLAGWIKPSSGEVIYKGEAVISSSNSPGKSWAREVQLVFQDPFGSLNPKIKIGHAIAEPMLVHKLVSNRKEARIKVCALLEKVGLSADYYDRYPHEFSGGQRQRIVIARALAVEPKVLVCDESVAALDVSVQAQVLNLLNELQQELGLSYLFISHDHNVIGYFCDRIIEMETGSIKSLPASSEADTQNIDVESTIELLAYTEEMPHNREPIDHGITEQADPAIDTTHEVSAVATETGDTAGIGEQEDQAFSPYKETITTVISSGVLVTDIEQKSQLDEGDLKTLSTSINSSDTVADQVSAELLRIRIKSDNRKMEKLAEEIHIPLVSGEIEGPLEEPLPSFVTQFNPEELTPEIVLEAPVQDIINSDIQEDINPETGLAMEQAATSISEIGIVSNGSTEATTSPIESLISSHDLLSPNDSASAETIPADPQELVDLEIGIDEPILITEPAALPTPSYTRLSEFIKANSAKK